MSSLQPIVLTIVFIINSAINLSHKTKKNSLEFNRCPCMKSNKSIRCSASVFAWLYWFPFVPQMILDKSFCASHLKLTPFITDGLPMHTPMHNQRHKGISPKVNTWANTQFNAQANAQVNTQVITQKTTHVHKTMLQANISTSKLIHKLMHKLTHTLANVQANSQANAHKLTHTS